MSAVVNGTRMAATASVTATATATASVTGIRMTVPVSGTRMRETS
ncbi:hypothetical protein ACTMUQ_22125 [Streptomyces sp. SD11]